MSTPLSTTAGAQPPWTMPNDAHVQLRRGRKRKNSVNPKEIHDLNSLEEITFENVLDCLVERYSLKQYYTFAGTLLISLNPSLHMQSSRNSLTAEQLRIQFKDHESNETLPHVFSIGKKCLTNLRSVGNNQVVVVSGNSGAGKTTATQQLIRYFIERNRKQTEMSTPNGLDKKICFATLILESLGNASTVANPNSSRFGRFVQLNYDRESGSIIGAQIRTCLLEKHRASKCSTDERNFHIFYYIFASLQKQQGQGLFNIADSIGDDMDWRTLIPTYFQERVIDSDEEQFLTLYQSLMNLKMTAELEKVFNIIFGIMVLLNVRFVGSEESSLQYAAEFTIEDSNAVQALGQIFGIDSEELVEVLVAGKITAGDLRRQSVIRKPCRSIRECEERLAALISHLYDALFHHVLDRLNSMLTTSHKRNSSHEGGAHLTSNPSDQIRTLSLLDLYGFEKLQNNQFEQLCINYANERLHKIHILAMTAHIDELANSEIPFESVELDIVSLESAERIASIEKCLFLTLDQACQLNRLSRPDKELFEGLGFDIKNKNVKHIELGNLHDPDCPFIVKHYAMNVKYNFKGMVGKNSDKIPPEFNEMLGKSSRLFLKTLIANLNRKANETASVKSTNCSQKDTLRVTSTSNSAASRNKSQSTIWQRFKVSVDDLMKELGNEENQDIQFIRCIRPNNEQNERKVDRGTVREQLLASGIVDIIRITGNGFPIRIAKSKFSREFSRLLKRCSTCGIADLKTFLLQTFNICPTELRFGKTQIFLTEKIWTHLQRVEDFISANAATTLQRSWRSYKKRKEISTQLDDELVQEINLDYNNSPKEPQNGNDGLFLKGGGDSSWYCSNWYSEPIPVPKIFREAATNTRTTFRTAITKLAELMSELNLRFGDGIVSRGCVYTERIRIYTKKTVLPYGHVCTKRLTSQGLLDVFPDHYEQNLP